MANNKSQEVTNFARFYALLNNMQLGSDEQREEAKQMFVNQYTDGRTRSLREMTTAEYLTMCTDLERLRGDVKNMLRDELRHRRSVCLHLMQKIGIDTTDWSAVNNYCLSPRIAGAVFRELDIDSLENLALKLRIILKKQKNK